MNPGITTTRPRWNTTFLVSPLGIEEARAGTIAPATDPTTGKDVKEVVMPFPDWRIVSVTPYRRVKRDRPRTDPNKPVRSARRSPLLLVTVEEHSTGHRIVFGEIVKIEMNTKGTTAAYTAPPAVIVNPVVKQRNPAPEATDSTTPAEATAE